MDFANFYLQLQRHTCIYQFSSKIPFLTSRDAPNFSHHLSDPNSLEKHLFDEKSLGIKDISSFTSRLEQPEGIFLDLS